MGDGTNNDLLKDVNKVMSLIESVSRGDHKFMCSL